jgi:hypothetical protein
MNNDNKPIQLGGLGKTQYRENAWYSGDRVYDSRGVAVTLTAEPCGRTGGYTCLYLVKVNENH